MRRIRYNCAMSLDGYIADANDGFDWIAIDPDINFDELSSQFDTYLIGRRTFEVVGGQGQPTAPGIRKYVFSKTLRQSECENIRVIGENWREVVRSLRAEPGKDVWLFGGGRLFGSLCAEGLVDTVEVAIIPILLGSGIPLVAGLSRPVELKLKEHRVYAKTGTVALVYEVGKVGINQESQFASGSAAR